MDIQLKLEVSLSYPDDGTLEGSIDNHKHDLSVIKHDGIEIGLYYVRINQRMFVPMLTLGDVSSVLDVLRIKIWYIEEDGQ